MIAHPLEISSRLQPAPRNFDAIFYVNAGLIALFFMLFGSRFVLAPGLDIVLPEAAGARAGAAAATCYISVQDSGQIFTASGMLSPAQLPAWLKARAAEARAPVLLIRASRRVPIDRFIEISSMAYQAGFGRIIEAAEDPATLRGGPP